MSREYIYFMISCLYCCLLAWAYVALVNAKRNPTQKYKWTLRVLALFMLIPIFTTIVHVERYVSFTVIGYLSTMYVLSLMVLSLYFVATLLAYAGFLISRGIRSFQYWRKRRAELAEASVELANRPPAANFQAETGLAGASAATAPLAMTFNPSAVMIPPADSTRSVPVPLDDFAESRRRWLAGATYGFVGLSGLTTVGAAWTASLGLQLHRITLEFPNLPPAFRGYRIVQISDLHSGRYMSEATMSEVREVAESLNADLAVFTGDQVDRSVEELPAFLNAFRGFHGRDGVYAIMGNHDYWSDGRPVMNGLNSGGFPVLLNRTAWLQRGEQSVALIGLDDLWAGYSGASEGPLLAQALRKVRPDQFKICLAHNPNCWDISGMPGIIDLTLSGHTHGGQINMVCDQLSPAILFSKYIRGHFQQGNSHLFVNTGVGYVGIPIRIGIPPEIVEITLA